MNGQNNNPSFKEKVLTYLLTGLSTTATVQGKIL